VSAAEQTQALEPQKGRTPPVITTQEEYVASVQRWQTAKYNILTPAVNLTGLAPQHGLVASMVQINPDITAGEVYQDKVFTKGDDVALAKVALRKIAECAGISITTTRTDDRTVPHLWEVKATATWRGVDGAVVMREATVEYDLRNGSDRIRGFTPAQVSMARAHGLRGAESRACNAVIRELGIKQKYSRAELARPFIVVRVMFVPDMSNPDQARAVLENALRGTSALYPVRTTALLPAAPEVLDRFGSVDTPVAQAVGRGATPAAQQTNSSAAPSPTSSAVEADQPPTPDAVRITDVRTRHGETNSRKWTRFEITDSHGVVHSTFHKSLADFAEKAKADRAWVDIVEERDGEFTNLVEMSPAGQQPSLLPDPSDL
jgi:hypothetical protein